MTPVFVCGEALVDFIPMAGASPVPGFVPKPGGSPYNVALAAARAGADARFVGALSIDMFGDMLHDHLVENGVDCRNVTRSDRPTTLAFVDVSRGSPRYAFHNIGTANVHMEPAIDGQTATVPGLLHVGSISLIEAPAADRIAALALDSVDSTLLSIDPNVRSGMIIDRDAWSERVNRLFDAAGIVKLSIEDLEFIEPGAEPDDYATQLLARGPEMVIITLGSDGAIAWTGDHRVTCRVDPARLADTVGGGDTLMGACLAWLADRGFVDRRHLASMSRDEAGRMLTYSVTAASLNCESEGCDPPRHGMIVSRMERMTG